MAKVRFNLDGIEVEARAGQTILEVAGEHGVEIPHLCHDPRLRPFGACRLCLVEVEGARGPVPACATAVADGMVVRTRTAVLAGLRRMALELLLSAHHGDCIAPCQLACPAGIDIQGFIAYIADGQYGEAARLIREKLPLPAVIGRVCPKFCERECRRNVLEDPVAICSLKRFAGDADLADGAATLPAPKPPTGKRVAVIGGGPAGLSATYYLALEGHAVTIFESSPKLGGMLLYGIPEYRLPKDLLAKEIATITALCEDVRTNAALGRDFTIEALQRGGYDAVFVAIGAQASQKLGVPGEDLDGVLPGIAFLRQVAEGVPVSLGRRVAIVGGGNTAMDAARTAVRLGAEEVTVVYRRSREEMPANPEEVAQAEDEGVAFQFQLAPVAVIGEGGKAVALRCVRMALGEPDASGRRRPVPIPGSEYDMPVDTIIAAIGQALDPSGLGINGQAELALDRRGNVQAEVATGVTPRAGVFSGGDCVTGPATAVEAVAAGRAAARSISQYLAGEAIAPAVKPYNCSRGKLAEIDPAEYADRERIERTQMPHLPPAARRSNFSEVELGYSEDLALAEARRCLSCGCQDVFECALRDYATEYAVNDGRFGHGGHRYRVRDDHRYIIRDANKCILCGNCVRICQEVQGVGALGFVHRGYKAVVEPALGLPLDETLCDSCGQCISACPTGALSSRAFTPKPGPWRTRAVASICPECGLGCRVDLQVAGNKVAGVTSPPGEGVGLGNLCRRGAFEYGYVHGENRVETPLIRKNGGFISATWDQAIAAAARGLREVRETDGPDRLAVLVSPALTNEENYLAQKLARLALGTNNVDSTRPVPNHALAAVLGRNASTATFDDLATSDLVMVAGGDLPIDYPIAFLRVKAAVERGAALVTVGPRRTRLDALARISLGANSRVMPRLLRTMLNYIFRYDLVDEGFVAGRVAGLAALEAAVEGEALEEVAEALHLKPAKVIELIHLYIRAKNPLIIIDADAVAPAELGLWSNLVLVTGNVGRPGAGIITLHRGGNAQGQLWMGVAPDTLLGQQPAAVPAVRARLAALWGGELPLQKGRGHAEIIDGIGQGKIRGLLVAGGDLDPAALGGAGVVGGTASSGTTTRPFTVVISHSHNELTAAADVILPGATFAETDGTFTNCEGKTQRLNRAVPPPAGKQNWQVLSELATALGYRATYPGGVAGVAAEIEAAAAWSLPERPFVDGGRAMLYVEERVADG